MPAVRPGIRCARIREPSWCHAFGSSSGARAHSPVPSRIAELVALSAYPTRVDPAATDAPPTPNAALLLSPRGRSDVEHRRSREKRQRAASRTTRLDWNANSHADRHGHDCPSAPAMQQPAGRPPPLVSHELLNSKHKSSSLADIARTAAFGQRQPRERQRPCPPREQSRSSGTAPDALTGAIAARQAVAVARRCPCEGECDRPRDERFPCNPGRARAMSRCSS